MTEQLRWVKPNSYAVDDALDYSLPRFKHKQLKVAVHLVNIQHPRNVRLLITRLYNYSDLHNSMGEIIHEASVAAISTVEQ